MSDRPGLAAYISAATVDLARVSRTNGKLNLSEHVTYACKEFPDLESVLRLYLKKSKGNVEVACLGVAGPVINNQVQATNLPWRIRAYDIAAGFSFGKVILINDIIATAHGLNQLDESKFFQVNKGKPVRGGNIGLIAAGAGLGEALIFYENGHPHPYASEGGHADFAPGNQTEMELWEYLYASNGQVETEDVVSLRGIVSLYEFVCDSRGSKTAAWFDNAEDKAGAVIEHAISERDKDAVRALDIFTECYASEAANLALKGMTLGGIYIGGLIAPQIVTTLDRARFIARFVKRGKMGSLLADIPVGIIIEEKTALLGAAELSVAS